MSNAGAKSRNQNLALFPNQFRRDLNRRRSKTLIERDIVSIGNHPLGGLLEEDPEAEQSNDSENCSNSNDSQTGQIDLLQRDIDSNKKRQRPHSSRLPEGKILPNHEKAAFYDEEAGIETDERPTLVPLPITDMVEKQPP